METGQSNTLSEPLKSNRMNENDDLVSTPDRWTVAPQDEGAASPMMATYPASEGASLPDEAARINEASPSHEPAWPRYRRIIKTTSRMIKSHEQTRAKGNQYHALRCTATEENESLYIDSTELLFEMENPIAFLSQVGDTMHINGHLHWWLHHGSQELTRAGKAVAVSWEIRDYWWRQCGWVLRHKSGKINWQRIQTVPTTANQPNIAGNGLQQQDKPKYIPALSSKILHQDIDGATHETPWEYRRVLGQLNFLEKSTRPDIAYAVHQCSSLMASPKSSHKHAMLRIGGYVMKTRDRGMMMKPKDHY